MPATELMPKSVSARGNRAHQTCFLASKQIFNQIVDEQKTLASQETLRILHEFGTMSFSNIWELLLRAYMLRVTNVKDVCVDLAKSGAIENTWGGGNRKPRDQDIIKLKLS